MTCDTCLSAIAAAPSGDWPRGVHAHLAGCEACASAVVDSVLRHPPVVQVPATFAVDVARRVRLAEPVATRRAVAPTAGVVAASLLIASCAVWMALSGTVTVLPVAAILLAGGEAIVFAAWSLGSGGHAVPGRPSPR